jgi:hypothetical protein
MDESRFKLVKQTVIRPNNSPQNHITDLDRENHQKTIFFTISAGWKTSTVRKSLISAGHIWVGSGVSALVKIGRAQKS